MPVRQLLPFALPNGRQNQTGQLTVYFSPRLKEEGRLSDYPEWVDWPATLADLLDLRVAVNGVRVDHRRVGTQPSSAVWQAVFGPDTPVAPHRFVDFADTPLLSMASQVFSESVLDLYLRMVRLHPDGPPDDAELLALATAAGFAAGGGQSDAGSLAEAAAYRAPMADPDEDPIAEPEFDFHAGLGLLGHHPELLRHLGLAVDLEVELPAAPNQVRVVTGFGGGAQATEIALITLTTPDFLARPGQGEQTAGFLSLAQEKAVLSIIDPHLAASRLSGALDPQDEKGAGTLPALATRALTLLRPAAAEAYQARLKRQAELEADLQDQLALGGPPIQLSAEDVTVGHRIDVLEDGTWRSLFERQSSQGYDFPRNDQLAIEPKPDEGWNTLLLITEQADRRALPNPDTDLPIRPTAQFRLDDALYRWNGWSGAAPAPGNVYDSATGLAVAQDSNEPTKSQPVQVAIDYQVRPGSLPRLRFGADYQMRARCVDLAGNSRPLSTSPPAAAVVPPEPFGRLEPIATPTVLRRSPRPEPGMGDTPYELVLRSDFDVPDEEVAAIDRLLFPGRVAQDLCELHGLPKGGADQGSYAELARRDPLDLSDQTVVDPNTGEVMAGVDSTKTPGLIESGATRQEVAYLSDPAVGGLRFAFPGLNTAVAVPTVGAWPDRQSTRLVVAAGDDAPEIQPDPETDLRVSVPKAEIVPMSASFSIDPGLLDHFALWQRLTPTEQAQLRSTVVEGGHWMFTPARPLTLVHAVRRPLLAPAVTELRGVRTLGSTAIRLRGSLVVHGHSTERVSLTGVWTETIDDPALPAPVQRTTRTELGGLPVPRSDRNELAVAMRAPVHDTKRHLAQIDVEAFSSFANYFTDQQTITLANAPVQLDTRGVVAGTVEVLLPTGERARSGVDFHVDGPAGTVTRTASGALSPRVPHVVRYVALPISRTSNDDPQAKPFQLLMLNTAAPPPPVVDEIIPAFVRSEGAHSGQVLRIYLRRPWFTTGDGELLAVILDPADPTAATVVGRDPILPGPGPLAGPTPADFPRAVTVQAGVDGRRTAVGHLVSFDASTGRWFTDVELAPSFGYRPFLRLVLARYQPDSVDDAALSTLVSTEPVRLGVVRETVVSRQGDQIEVTTSGPGRPDNAVQVTVEQADRTITDRDLRWRRLAAPVRLVPGPGPDAELSTWSGSVVLPSTGDPLRAVVEELELGRRDEVGEGPVESVVFVETVEL